MVGAAWHTRRREENFASSFEPYPSQEHEGSMLCWCVVSQGHNDNDKIRKIVDVIGTMPLSTSAVLGSGCNVCTRTDARLLFCSSRTRPKN